VFFRSIFIPFTYCRRSPTRLSRAARPIGISQHEYPQRSKRQICHSQHAALCPRNCHVPFSRPRCLESVETVERPTLDTSIAHSPSPPKRPPLAERRCDGSIHGSPMPIFHPDRLGMPRMGRPESAWARPRREARRFPFSWTQRRNIAVQTYSHVIMCPRAPRK